MRSPIKHQSGFTLVEMIMVIVITGIIGGIVAVFIRAPVQGYVDSARRAELTDVADTAFRRLARDVRTAVPNSIRVAGCAGLCVEFLPTRDGGRYRTSSTGELGGCGAAGSTLSFSTADTCFEIIGSPITFVAGDQIVIGSTQSDGNPPYQDSGATGIRRAVDTSLFGSSSQVVRIVSPSALPAFSELSSQRFDVVDGSQLAVTYGCVTPGKDASGNGTGSLVRYSGYGFNPVQVYPLTGVTGHVLANNVSACSITYDVPSQRFGLLAIQLTLTLDSESVTLYNEVHVNNTP
jgi:MSHA biogenesis protein MshO